MNTKYKKHNIKGIIFSFLSAIGFANVYFFSKKILNVIPFSLFGFYWFGISSIIFLFLCKILNLKAHLKKISKTHLLILIIVSIIEVIATVMFFFSIKLIYNPSIVSFLTNSIPLFVSIFGYFFLKEKFNTWQYIGILIAIIGLFFLSYKKEVSIINMFDRGTLLVLGSSFLYAVNSILIKKTIKNIHPLLFSSLRVFFLFISFTVYVFFQGIKLKIPGKIFLDILTGSIIGPSLSIVFSIYAYRYIEATFVSIIVSSKSLLTVLFIFLYMGILPTTMQFTGGIISMIGIIVMLYGKHLQIKNYLALNNKEASP